jgi:glycerophosphoryl diester phosphodiesterase
MSNAIIKQGGQSLVADNIWHIRLGPVSFLLGVLTGAGAALALNRGTRADSEVVRPKTPSGWPVNFAHRGGAKVVPENTIEGFEEGLRLGGGVIELDVHATADGVVVVIHDPAVNRTTDGSGPVAEMTLTELQRLDAGYSFTADGGISFPWRGRGLQIPTLQAVYQAFPDRPINIELKGQRPGIEEELTRVIGDAGGLERTLVVTNRRAPIRRFRRASQGTIATAASIEEFIIFWLLTLLHLNDLYDPPFQGLQPPETYKGLRIVTRRLVREAHRRGLRVDVWTIDDEPSMRRLLSLGVDGIMTDRPDILAAVLPRSR